MRGEIELKDGCEEVNRERQAGDTETSPCLGAPQSPVQVQDDGECEGCWSHPPELQLCSDGWEEGQQIWGPHL